jgi:hypothetical protein
LAILIVEKKYFRKGDTKMRSVIISTLVLLMIGILAIAQVPGIINYQGRLTDDTGELVTDGEYPVRFRIWDDSTDGMMKWTSQPETVLVINGLFNFQLGSKENIPPSTFNDTSLWLGITVGTGPEVPEIEPRTRLVSTPYAYKAYQATYADSAEYADYADISRRLDACAGIEHKTTQVWTPPPASLNANEIKLVFPKTFTNIANMEFTFSVVVTTGTCAGYPGRVTSVTHTIDYAVIELQGWNGSNWTDLASGDEVDVSYIVFEQ